MRAGARGDGRGGVRVLARTVDDVRRIARATAGPAPEPGGRGIGPRRHDALVRGDRRRRRDPAGRRLLPLRQRSDLRGPARRSTPGASRSTSSPAIEALKRAGILDDVGGPLYMRDLVDQVPTPASAAHYARIVSQTALLRRLIGAAADIMDMAYAAPADPEGVADDAEQRIYDVARREDARRGRHPPRPGRPGHGRPGEHPEPRTRPTPGCPPGSATSTTSRRGCSRAT